MSDIKLQGESIQLSIYCNIICRILQYHGELSICKLVTFSYLIKKNRFFYKSIYKANNTQDLIYKGISLLSGDFEGFSISVPYIIKSLHLLKNKKIVEIENEKVFLTEGQMTINSIYEESSFMTKVIEESKMISDRQFMKEVVYSV